jgi:CARDB protein
MKSKLFFAKKVLVMALALVISMSITFLARPDVALARVGPQLPDIRAKIFAFSDPNFRNDILNLQTLGPLGKSFVRFTISNNGPGQATNFTYKAVVRLNGVKVFDPPTATITLNPGQSITFVTPIVHNASGQNKVEAKLLADIGNFVTEIDEVNNSRTFTYTVIN